MAKSQPVHDACNVPTSHHPHGQTAACENIIFPELHLRAVTSKFLLASFYSASEDPVCLYDPLHGITGHIFELPH